VPLDRTYASSVRQLSERWVGQGMLDFATEIGARLPTRARETAMNARWRQLLTSRTRLTSGEKFERNVIGLRRVP